MIEFIGRKPLVMAMIAFAIVTAFTIVLVPAAAAVGGGSIVVSGNSQSAYAQAALIDGRQMTLVDVSGADYSDQWGEGSFGFVGIHQTRNAGQTWSYFAGGGELLAAEFHLTATGAVLDATLEVCAFKGKMLKPVQCVATPVHVDWIAVEESYSVITDTYTDGGCTVTSTTTVNSKPSIATISIDFKTLSSLEGFGSVEDVTWQDEYEGDCVIAL